MAPSRNTDTTEGEEHTHRVLGGFKATLNNPKTSESAKERAKEVLDERPSEPQAHAKKQTDRNEVQANSNRGGDSAANKKATVEGVLGDEEVFPEDMADVDVEQDDDYYEYMGSGRK